MSAQNILSDSERLARRRRARSARRRARLAAVQALYQIDLLDADPARVIEEFAERLSGGPTTDFDFFRALVAGVSAAREVIDERVAETLAQGWRLERLSVPMRALLRAAAYEFDRFRDIPPQVTVSEYVDIAGDFFTRTETGFVNGVVETLARRLRGADWKAGEPSSDGPPAG